MNQVPLVGAPAPKVFIPDNGIWFEIAKAAAANAVSVDDIVPLADQVLAAYKERFGK